jgi:hypothetical protein
VNYSLALLTCVLAFVPRPASAQEGNKWKPYQFTGNERYEYKFTMYDGEEKKEGGFILDIRKKTEEDWEVTVSNRSAMKKTQGAEVLMGNIGLGMSPVMFLMNPLYGAFIEQVEMKEGEKMSLFGAAVIKVGKKETIGGRSGFACELLAKNQETQKEEVSWAFTIDPALALPIKSITMENGKPKFHFELVSYKKD